MAKYSQWLKELESQNNLLWAPWFIMAIIIGIGRLAEEALAVYLPKGGTISFGVAVNFVTFYAQTIWVYVGAASILTRQLWPRTMGPVMLGTLLGVLPPVIDVVIYGIGNFDYFYQFDYPNHIFGPIPVDLARGLPLGEVLIAYASVGLFAFYVGLRSRSTGRTVLALIAGYELMHFWGSGLPSLAARLEQTVHLSLTTTISLVQIAIIVGIYYSLNPKLLRQAFYRLPHAIPASMLILLGGAIAQQPIGATIIVSLIACIVTVFVVHQNDFYDKLEDATEGRISALTRESLHFFQSVTIMLIVVIVAYRNIIAGCIAIFCFLTLLYHHRRFRLKRIFPLNYLIEGICAAMMVTVGMTITANIPPKPVVYLGAAAGFLGFTLGSPFKDYKDIDGDEAANNQTCYTIAHARNWSMRSIHFSITVILTLLTFAPIIWLYWRGATFSLCAIMGLFVFTSIPTTLLLIRDRKRATQTTLCLVNIYLLTYATIGWQLG